jgi:RES domain-containing protein
MLNPPALAPAVVAARPQAIALSTVVFRSIHLRHFSNFAAAQPLFAAPGGLAGSRYIPPNGPAALYLAFDADTAHREGNQPYYQTAATPAGPALLHAGGLRPDPLVVIGVHVRLSHLLDLRDALTRLQLGIQAVTEILAPWKGVAHASTQVLGDAVFNDGHFEGIVYPSVQNPGHDCLVVFPARRLAASRLDFFDPVTGVADHMP